MQKPSESCSLIVQYNRVEDHDWSATKRNADAYHARHPQSSPAAVMGAYIYLYLPVIARGRNYVVRRTIHEIAESLDMPSQSLARMTARVRKDIHR